MTAVRFPLDERVGRVFERVLHERGFEVEQAKDRFGEHTVDGELLRWCADDDWSLITNNAKDFESLHREIDHAGLLLFHDQSLPDDDPEGLARTVEEVVAQYGNEGTTNAVVDLGERYDWIHD